MGKIRIHHIIDVEDCIAAEIRELNNVHNIVTTYSCCGHRVGPAWVKVKSREDIDKMLILGYKKLGTEQVWIYKAGPKRLRRLQIQVEQVFRLRSKCKCKEKVKKRMIKWP